MQGYQYCPALGTGCDLAVCFILRFVDGVFELGDGKYAFRVLDQTKLFFTTNDTVSAELLIAHKR